MPLFLPPPTETIAHGWQNGGTGKESLLEMSPTRVVKHSDHKITQQNGMSQVVIMQ